MIGYNVQIDGNVSIAGDLTVRNLVVLDEIKTSKVLAEKINITTPPAQADGTSNASIGEAKIIAGQTEVIVETTAVTDKSRVFVTATTSTGGQTLIVGTKKAGESFTVNIDNPAASDIEFNWWVVN